MENNVGKIKKELCTGCYACMNACPINCIRLEQDNEGFGYPLIDTNNCNNCGLCIKSCPSMNEKDFSAEFKNPDVYAGWSLEDNIRLNSSSGGIFSEIATKIIESGGYVAGARFDTQNRIEHCLINNLSDIHELRRSKYAQSFIGTVFSEIRTLLENKKNVLFCGTPCHVAGLLRFLGSSHHNLITCDFVCLGVNSPKVFKKYLSHLEKEFNSKIKNFHFRDKSEGWINFRTAIEFEDGRISLRKKNSDPFMRGYIKYPLYIRPSCYACQYKFIPHLSDITLADFWGIEKYEPELVTSKGTSLIMINSIKGRKLFESISDRIFFKEQSLNNALPKNMRIVSPAKAPLSRKLFFSNVDKMPLPKIINICLKIENFLRFFLRIKLHLKAIIKKESKK